MNNLTSDDYIRFKSEALANQPLLKKINLMELEVTSKDTISVQGHPLKMSSDALRSLINILGLPIRFTDSIDDFFGGNSKQKLINLFKTAVAAKKNMEVVLVGDKRAKQLVSVLPKHSAIPYEKYFEIFERLMDKHHLEIKSAINSDHKLALSTVSKNSEFNIKGFSDEVFYPGFSLITDLRLGTVVDTFVYRLVCGNGMMGSPDSYNKIVYDPSNGGGKFFEELDKLEGNGFYPGDFKERIMKAMRVNASLSELKEAATAVKGAGNITNDNIDSFIPLNATLREFQAKGLDLTKVTSAQEKTAITNTKVWDLVNGMTDFASHDYGFHTGDRGKLDLQVSANKLLTKKAYDTENLIYIKL